MRETRVRFLGREDPLEKEMVTHSSFLAWRSPWTEKPVRLQSTGSRRVGLDWATSLFPVPMECLTLGFLIWVGHDWATSLFPVPTECLTLGFLIWGTKTQKPHLDNWHLLPLLHFHQLSRRCLLHSCQISSHLTVALLALSFPPVFWLNLTRVHLSRLSLSHPFSHLLLDWCLFKNV